MFTEPRLSLSSVHLVIIIEVILVVADDDGDGPGPGALDPLDVAGGEVGGVVVAGRQHGV